MLKKKGLSPVIATMLLITLALILAVIIFLWARSFIGENILKQNRAIALSCEEISFDAQAGGGVISIINLGSIPIHGVEVKKSAFLGDVTSVRTLDSSNNLVAGQSADFAIDFEVQTGNELTLTPILLGEDEDGNRKTHVCDESYGKKIIVQ